MKNIDKTIEKKIATKKIKMKSRSYFFAISILYVVSVIVITLFSLFLASFIFFVLHISGANYLFGFGTLGVLPYLRSIPWFLIMILITFILLIEIFSKKIRLISQKPLIYSLVTITIAVISFGLVFADSNIHHHLLKQALSNKLPVAGPLYRNYGNMPKKNKITGKVLEINDDKIIIATKDKDVEILVSGKTSRLRRMKIKIGDQLHILVENINGQIHILNVRKIGQKRSFFSGFNK